MPKKTRKEKIIAEYRKRMKLLQQMNLTSPENINLQAEVTDKQIVTPPAKLQEMAAEEKTDQSKKIFFIQDLKKSLLFIVIIITLEITIYFGTISKYFGGVK